MRVKEFCEGFESKTTDNAKTKYVRDNINIVQYVPIQEKIKYAEMITVASNMPKGEVKLNSPIQYILQTVYIVKVWTDLEVDETVFLEEYDFLKKSGVLPVLSSFIPADELEEFASLVSMMKTDMMDNNLSFSPAWDRNVKRVIDIVMALLPEPSEGDNHGKI